MPLVTVITPAYNRTDLITQTIESVLSQSYDNFEYLIIDDGSTDNTEYVVKPYLNYNRVKYYKYDNKGEPESVNRGWKLAKGDYFLQINSDDLLMENCLEEMVRTLESNKNTVVAYSDLVIIDYPGKIIEKSKNHTWDFFTQLQSFSCLAATPATMIRCSAFRNWDHLRENRFLHINDIEMYWNMALVGDFIYVPKFLAKWRSHEGGISNNRYKSIIECKQWYEDYFSKNKFNEKIKQNTKKSIDEYVICLLNKADIGMDEKIKIYKEYIGTDMINLQIGDNDLIGNKFNGHCLHLYLRSKGVLASHLVLNKQSDNENTYVRRRNEGEDILSIACFYMRT